MSRIGTFRISSQGNWHNIGNITTVQAALGATNRLTTTADALTSTGIITYDIDAKRPYGFLLRVRSDGSENDSNILHIYVSKGNDYYTRVVTLDTAQGTVVHSDGTYFADIITPSNEDLGMFEGIERSIADEIGFYYFRSKGHDRIFICASTKTSTTVYVDIANMYE